MEICTTGKWVDKKTGQVVDSQPEEGRLLVAPGTAWTPNLKAQVERAQASAPPVPTEPEPEQSADDESKAEADTETASEASAPETAAKSGRTGTARKS